jgi:hypothetical protein
MTATLYLAMSLTVASFGVGVAAIVNAVRVNREKHGEPPVHEKVRAHS